MLAAALHALACLCMGHARNAAALASQPGLAAALGLALEQRADAWTADYDSASAVLAAHTLLHVLGHVLCNAPAHGGGGGGGSGAAGGLAVARRATVSQVVSVVGSDADLADGAVRVVVSDGTQQDAERGPKASWTAAESRSCKASQAGSGAATAPQKAEVVYLSLATAAEAVGVSLPFLAPGARKDGSSTLLPIHRAELR